MDVSKAEQRVLHALAQGGVVLVERDEARKIGAVHCVTRDGWYLTGMTVAVFRKLKRRKLIASRGGGPYRITGLGLLRVRSQMDNR